MINICIPDNNISERVYILDVFLKEFLGLDYNLIIESNKKGDWVIEFENKNRLIFEDHFFNKFIDENEYLNIKNIPTKINFYTEKDSGFISEEDLPIIFGNSFLESKINDNREEIFCSIDIFASSFFMLSRWEEYVNKSRDLHDRFPSFESLAFKCDFLDRPIVNEYIFFFKSLIKKLDSKISIKKREYKMFVTHDVDVPLLYSSWRSGIGEIIRDVMIRKNLLLAAQNMIFKLKSIFKLSEDPYYTFDFLMNLSDHHGLKSYFFFMAKGNTHFDNRYSLNSPEIKLIISKIKKRGHYIGIHPSYASYNNVKQFLKEKNELEMESCIDNICFGRQHFLRFEVPTTWQVWEDNNMQWDSTLSYADKEGFRCGVCYDFSVFNILSRKKLNLKEKPLIVMEGSFATYQENVSKQEMICKINSLQRKVKKYKGNFVLLWHNSSFNTPFWKKYNGVYESIIKFK